MMQGGVKQVQVVSRWSGTSLARFAPMSTDTGSPISSAISSEISLIPPPGWMANPCTQGSGDHRGVQGDR